MAKNLISALLGNSDTEPQVVFQVNAKDLCEVVNYVVARGKEEQQQRIEQQGKAEIYLSAKETAKKLGISLTTLWQWSKDKTKITPIHIGRKVRYKLSDVERILQGEVFA